MIQHSSTLNGLKGENERLDLVLEIKANAVTDSLSFWAILQGNILIKGEQGDTKVKWYE